MNQLRMTARWVEVRTSPLLTLRSSSNSIIRYTHLGLFTISLSTNQSSTSRCREGFVALDEISRRLDRGRVAPGNVTHTLSLPREYINLTFHDFRTAIGNRKLTVVRKRRGPTINVAKTPTKKYFVRNEICTKRGRIRVKGIRERRRRLEVILMIRVRGSIMRINRIADLGIFALGIFALGIFGSRRSVLAWAARVGYIRSNGVRSQALLSHFVLQCFNISLCLCHANHTGRRRGRRPGARIILDEGESEGIFARATRIKARLRFSDWSGCSDLGPAVRPKVRTRARFKPRSTSPSIRLNTNNNTKKKSLD